MKDVECLTDPLNRVDRTKTKNRFECALLRNPDEDYIRIRHYNGLKAIGVFNCVSGVINGHAATFVGTRCSVGDYN